MKKRFLLIFLPIFLVLILGVFQIASIAANGLRFYYFDDIQRNVEYPKSCASCGANLLSISAVPEGAGKDKMTVRTPRGMDYTVKKTAVADIIDAGGIFTEINDWLYCILYDADQIDFYCEEEMGKLDSTSFYIETTKYGIKPLTAGEKNANLISNSGKNGSYPFFVCKNCNKCHTSCSEYVASNGFSIPPMHGYEKDTSKLIIGKYCERHTCAFIWNINNGNFNISTVEGIDCKEEALAGSLFCREHTCKDPNCNKPVIGCNATDSRSTQLRIYQGPDENQYSNYCVDHFCKHYMCKGQRRSVTSATAPFIQGRYIQFPEYCALHGDDCTIYDCNNPVIKRHYDEKNEIAVYICEYHAEHYEELQRQAIELGMQEAGKVPDSDVLKDYCANCKKYLAKEQISTGKKFGKTINGKWYCGKCAAQGLTVMESVNDFENGGGFIYHTATPPTSQFADPENCTHSRYPVPNTVKFTNITKEKHTQVWTCINCNTTQRETYEHIFVNGICVCGYKQNGYAPEGSDNEDPYNEDQNNNTPLVEITNAKYIMPYDDSGEVILVQLKDSDKIQLKIAKNKLTTLTYKWGTKVIGYSDSSVKIPSSETLKISEGNSKVTDYVMERPDYILTVQYYTKEENAKRTTITYQIYLP